MALLKGGLLVYKEEAIGSIDGVNTTFITSFKFIPASLVVKLNGLEQEAPSDYVVITDQRFDFVEAPIGGIDPDVVTVTYQRA